MHELTWCHKFCPWSSICSPPDVTFRSHWLLHYTNCCMSSWTTFSNSRFTNDMFSWNQSHTLYNTHSYLSQGPSIVCVYHSSSNSTLRSQFLVWVLSSSSYRWGLVTSCFLIISLSWIIPLSCCFGLWLPLACNITCLLYYPFAQPSGLCSPSFDPCLSLDHSFILPTTYLSAIV